MAATRATAYLERPAVEAPLTAEVLRDDLVALVGTPSVTGVHSERAMVERIEALLAPTGCELTVVESIPERPSLAAVLPGALDSSLVLNGHMDTVPPDDTGLWSVDPFGGSVRDGAVWGRGAVDMKAGLTCQIACLRALAAVPAAQRGTLTLHFAAGEETGEPGTMSLLERGFTGAVGICTEPTELDVARAQRGVAYFNVRLHGRSAHAGHPQLGANPIAVLAPLLEALERYERELEARVHPLFRPSTATPTMVRAGVQQNAVPDVCDLVIDRRLLPGDTSEQVRDELARLVAGALAGHDGISAAVEQIHNEFLPAEIPERSDFLSRVCDVVERTIGRTPRVTGTPYGSDVRNLINDAGIEAVTFGPGELRWMHSPDEHIAIADLVAGARAITAIALAELTEGDGASA